MSEQNNPYEYWDNLIEGAKKERELKNQQFNEDMKEISEQYLKKREEDSALFYKALQVEHDANEKAREQEIEQAKKEAQAQVEAAYKDKHGLKSEKEKAIDKAYSDMLKELMKEG